MADVPLDEATPLGPLTSRYIDVASLPWKATPTPGIEMKILFQDKSSGLLTALFRWQPGTALPLHEHVEIEQTYVLSGSIVDDEGEVIDVVVQKRRDHDVALTPLNRLLRQSAGRA